MIAMGAPSHSGMLEIPAKMHRYGRWVVDRHAKTTGFPGESTVSKNGGMAPRGQKCVLPREKRDRYGFKPLKRPGFLLEQSQTMSKTSETPRKNAQTARKPPIG